MSTAITVAYGDSIGPEIMEAAMLVLREAGADLEITAIEIGDRIYSMGARTGILPSAYETLKRTRVLLKGPTTRPEYDYFRDVTDTLCRDFEVDMQARVTEAYEHGQAEDTPSFIAAAYVSEQLAIFEPVYEALPLAGKKDTANPVPALLATTMMLRHIGQERLADNIHQALLDTLEAGIHTPDIYRWRASRKKVGTQGFAEAVTERLVASARPLLYNANP